MSQWRVTRASAIGPAHQLAGVSKQDMGCVSRFRHDGQTYIAIAVADGASSAPKSEDGAKLAVDQAVKSLKKSAGRQPPVSGEDAIARAIAHARDDIRITAKTTGNPLEAYHTTLLATLIGPTILAAGQTGDGGIVIQSKDRPDAPSYAVLPQHGENKGETRFITGAEHDWAPQVNTYQADDIIGIAMFTDGLDPACIQSGQPLPGFFVNLFDWHRRTNQESQRNRELTELVAGPQLRSVSRDDVTLVVVTRAV